MALGWQFTPGTGPTYPWVAEIDDWEAPTLRRLDRGGGEITLNGGGLVAKHVPGIVLYSNVPLDLTLRAIE